MAVVVGGGLAYLSDLVGVLRSEVALNLWQRAKALPLVAIALGEPVSALALTFCAGLLLLLLHERVSGMADIRYAGHGSKQFYIDGDLKRPVHFLFQARFLNTTQQETANVSARADFWSAKARVTGIFCHWAVGFPPGDNPSDSGSKSGAPATVIPPGDIPARLNLAMRPEGQGIVVPWAAMDFGEGPVLVRLRLAGTRVREKYWLFLRNVPEAQRERALVNLLPPRASLARMQMWLARRRLPSSPSIEAPAALPAQELMPANDAAEPRVFTAVSAKELTSPYRGNLMSFEADKLAERYKRTWRRQTLRLENLQIWEGYAALVGRLIEDGHGYIVTCYFSDKWIEALRAMPRGTMVEVVGQIKFVTSGSFVLYHSELVEPAQSSPASRASGPPETPRDEGKPA